MEVQGEKNVYSSFLLQAFGIIESYFFPLEVVSSAFQSSFIHLDCLSCESLTMENLRKCGLIIMDWWYLCKKNGECVDQLLFHCEVANGRYGMSFLVELALLG